MPPSPPELLIGCPVSHRAWVLPTWFDHVERACEIAEVLPAYVFVVDVQDPSWAIIRDRAHYAVIIGIDDPRPTDLRDWRDARYHRMVELRNHLLHGVRAVAPAAFLSLDSDILLHPEALLSLQEGLQHYDAVGARCYMTPTGVSVPSWGRLGRENTLQRVDAAGLIPVEIIMAAKLMSPAAYHVDYVHHLQGEDIGWSLACAAAGLKLGWDGRYISKHVLEPEMLERIDPRVGW